MPGHIGTDIVINSRTRARAPTRRADAEQVAQVRDASGARHAVPTRVGRRHPQRMMEMVGEGVPRQRAADGRAGGDDHPRRRAAGEWRILVGDDAHRLDEAVRAANPEGIYDEGGVNLLSVMQPGS